MVQTLEESGTSHSYLQPSGVLLNDGCTLPSWCWPPWRAGRHGGESKGSKQSMLVPFHVKQKGLNTSRGWMPVEHSGKGNLICQLEKKPWGHLSASAWFRLCFCYFSCFCMETKTQRTNELLCGSRTPLWLSILQLHRPRDTLSTPDWWPKNFMLHLPFARISFQNLHLNRNTKVPTCLSVTLTVLSGGGISSQKHFSLNEADSWHMKHSPVRGRILLAHSTPSDVRTSIRLHKLFFLFVKSERVTAAPPGISGFYHQISVSDYSIGQMMPKQMCP